MSQDKERPEDVRERLRQEELKKPYSAVHGSNLADLVGGLGWKAVGVIILLVIVFGVILSLIFN